MQEVAPSPWMEAGGAMQQGSHGEAQVRCCMQAGGNTRLLGVEGGMSGAQTPPPHPLPNVALDAPLMCVLAADYLTLHRPGEVL